MPFLPRPRHNIIMSHNIIFKKVHGEKGSADNVCAKKGKSNKIAAFLDSFCENDIYNADKTGLYYRATPDGSLCYKHIDLNGFKKAMDCIHYFMLCEYVRY